MDSKKVTIPKKRKGKKIKLQQQDDLVATKPKKKKLSKMDSYLEYFKLYNEFKMNYDNKQNLIKKKIKKMENKSWEEKRDILRKKSKCVICKGAGGSIFSYTNGIYNAKCNALVNKCPFNIELKKPQVILITNRINEINELLELIKQAIIQKKLNLIFNLENETIVTEDFSSFRENYRNLSRELINIQKILDDNLQIEERNKNILEGEKIYKSFINDFKIAIIQYNENNNFSIIKEKLDQYKQEIKPLIPFIRNNKYEYVDIKETTPYWQTKLQGKRLNNIYRLIQKKNIIEKEEYVIVEPEIIKFKTKKKSRKRK